MRTSTAFLTLALSLASGALARPQQNQYGQQATTTFDGGYGSQPTGVVGGSKKIPKQCSMFKPYVAPALLGPICSLHMTPLPPGSMPIVPTSCLSGPVSEQTLPAGGDDDDDDDDDDSYQQQTTLDGAGGGYEQQTTLQAGGGYQQQSTLQAGGGYGQPTTTDRGYNMIPIQTPADLYGQTG